MITFIIMVVLVYYHKTTFAFASVVFWEIPKVVAAVVQATVRFGSAVMASGRFTKLVVGSAAAYGSYELFSLIRRHSGVLLVPKCILNMSKVVYEIISQENMDRRLLEMHAYKNTGVTSTMKSTMIHNHVNFIKGQVDQKVITNAECLRILNRIADESNPSASVATMVGQRLSSANFRKSLIEENKTALVLTPYHFFTTDGLPRNNGQILKAFVLIHENRKNGMSIVPVAVKEAISYCIKMRKKDMTKQKLKQKLK